MDRNPNDQFSTPAGGSGTGGTPGFQNTGGGYGGGGMNTGTGAGLPGATPGSTGTGTGDGSRDLADRAQDAKETAQDKLARARETANEKIGQAREKAGELKNRLADTLDNGANRLREKTVTATPAYATGDGAAVSATPDARARVGEKVAGGMHTTADWLRENDLDSMKRGIEEQVRTNPGRSLLVAAVAGYLLGKALRK